MPAYMVEIEHRETDQVFSYYHGDGMLHFNASLLARLHKAMPTEFARITMDIDEGQYDLCMTHRGIEEPKVASLKGKNLREPGYAVLFDDDGSFTIVDGHHRLVRRYRGGIRTMDFWIAPEAIWRHCLVEYTAEHEKKVAETLAPREENAPMLASKVRLHDKTK